MRDVALLAAVVVFATALGVIADADNWLSDQPGLVVIAFLAAALFIAGVCADLSAHRRRR